MDRLHLRPERGRLEADLELQACLTGQAARGGVDLKRASGDVWPAHALGVAAGPRGGDPAEQRRGGESPKARTEPGSTESSTWPGAPGSIVRFVDARERTKLGVRGTNRLSFGASGGPRAPVELEDGLMASPADEERVVRRTRPTMPDRTSGDERLAVSSLC